MEIDLTELPAGPVSELRSVAYGSAPGEMRDGLWQHNVDGYLGAAGYLGFELDTTVTRIGCEAIFRGKGSGAIALVLPTEDWSAATGPWAAALHFVSKRTHWELTYFGEDQRKPVYARGVYLRPLPVGVPQTFEIEVDGPQAMLTLPTGRTVRVEHELLRRATEHAVFELFTDSASATPAALARIWAS